jgi:ABC-type multidrug transport system permease subunit
MDTFNVMMSIQILSIMLFFGLPYLARLIYLNTEAISFILFIILFWLICSFVAIVSVYTWTAGFGV